MYEGKSSLELAELLEARLAAHQQAELENQSLDFTILDAELDRVCALMFRAISEEKPDYLGRKWWHYDYSYYRKGKILGLSKSTLGIFTEAVLRHGGQLGSFHAMNPKVPRSCVLVTVRFTDKQKAAFEAETGFLLSPPPKISLSTGWNK